MKRSVKARTDKPMRTCVGCRGRKPQHELLRMALNNVGKVVFSTRKRSGRGAYLCPDGRCIMLAVRKQAFARAFRRSVEKVSAPLLYHEACSTLAQTLGSCGTKEQKPGGRLQELHDLALLLAKRPVPESLGTGRTPG